MRVLLTGGTGFIGQRLVERLRARGDTITALVRRTSVTGPLERAGARLSVGDLLTGEGLDAAVADVDHVLHLAGVIKARSAVDYQRGNGDGTRLLVDACARRSKPPKVTYCSSLTASGPSTRDRPRDETDVPAPISAYGRSKLAGEQALRDQCERVPGVIVRPPIVYGPGDKEFVPSVLPMAKLGVYIKSGLGEKRYSLIHVEDLCDGLLAAADRGHTLQPSQPAEGVYHLADGPEHRWQEICGALSSAMGKSKPVIISLPDWITYVVGFGGELQSRLFGTVTIMNLDKAREMRCQAWTGSSARARAELGFSPRFTLDTGLRDTIAWCRQQGLVA